MSNCKNCRFWKVQAPGGMLHPMGRKPHMCTLRLYEYTDQETGEEHAVPSLQPTHTPGPRFGEFPGPKETCSYVVSKGMPTRKKHRPDKNKKKESTNEHKLHTDGYSAL